MRLLVYAVLGNAALGALRPWWLTLAWFLAWIGWWLVLLVPGRLAFPRAAEQRQVAAVYRALATYLRALGTENPGADHDGAATAMNLAADELLGQPEVASRRDRELALLMSLIRQADWPTRRPRRCRPPARGRRRPRRSQTHSPAPCRPPRRRPRPAPPPSPCTGRSTRPPTRSPAGPRPPRGLSACRAHLKRLAESVGSIDPGCLPEANSPPGWPFHTAPQLRQLSLPPGR